ncbi:hypothetical protein DL769_011571 [Monosporascus sp. CRB-8-3]|nr:hypothetical protein DL769_011571 [Monosporascus sp. CRB-8-3]
MGNPMLKGLLASLAVTHQTFASQSTYNLTLHLPSQRPTWAQKLSPHLAGFSLETDRWPDWAGWEIGKPNEFFNQLLLNFAERTGHMPFLRVGANFEDRGSVDLGLQVMNATYPDPTDNVPNPEADHIYIGRDWYALLGNLPAGTPFMWGLNLKYLDKAETVAHARLLAQAFQGERANLTKHVKLANVEIGNEPDFYDPTRSGIQGPYGKPLNNLIFDLNIYVGNWCFQVLTAGTSRLQMLPRTAFIQEPSFI